MYSNLAIAAVMVVGIGGLVYAQRQADLPAPGTAATSTASALDQVAAHATRESCWSLINGNVYDLTSWIPQHPGGEQAILQLCGADGSAKFNGQHGGSARQEAILAGFKIDVAASGAAPAVPAPVMSAPSEEDDFGRGRGRGGDDTSDDD